jgi:hypothetical protein
MIGSLLAAITFVCCVPQLEKAKNLVSAHERSGMASVSKHAGVTVVDAPSNASGQAGGATQSSSPAPIKKKKKKRGPKQPNPLSVKKRKPATEGHAGPRTEKNALKRRRKDSRSGAQKPEQN